MTTWHTDQPKPKDLAHPTMLTVVVDKPGEPGYTMAFTDFNEATIYLHRFAGTHGEILLPTRGNK
jgi:hypothetical protein